MTLRHPIPLALFVVSFVSLWAIGYCQIARGQSGPGMGGPPSKPSPRRATSSEKFDALLHQNGGPAFGPTGPGRKLVTDVRVVGNETVSSNRVYSHLKTRRDRVFDPVIVEADVRRLVSSGLFQDVRTFTQPTPQGVAVTFQVFERPTIRYVRYIGNRGASERKLNKETSLKVGDALNAYAVEEARRKIEELYVTRGYTKTTVSIVEGNKPRDRGVVFVISESKLQRLAGVKIIGNDPALASDARLKTRIKSKPGYFWLVGGRVDRNKIDADVDRLVAYYRSLGYFRARVGREMEYDDSGKWLTLTFVIDEGPRYKVRSVSIVGNQKYDTDDLVSRLKLKSDDYFHASKMDADVNALWKLYAGQGHIYADVKADPRFLEEPGWLDLVYKVKEGGLFRVGSIHVHIQGEYPHTRSTVIKDRLSFRTGDIIDIRKIQTSERRLKASQLFENDPTRGATPKIVVRPPELSESIAQGRGSTFRGQSPDPRRTANPVPRTTYRIPADSRYGNR